MQRLLVGIEVLHKGDDAALIAEVVLFFRSLIFDGYGEAPIEKGQLSQPGG